MEEKKEESTFEAVMKMMEEKRQNKELKKISDVDVETEIQNKITLTKEEEELDREIERDEIADSITIQKTKKIAEDVDIEQVKLTSISPLERSKLISQLLHNKASSFEVTAAQSGYSCKLSPLNNKDSFNILNSSNSQYESLRITYKTIYEKIAEFSCGYMDFDTWLKYTTVGDLDTLYYGLYCATFLDEGTFRFRCTNPECDHVNEEVIRNSSLIRVDDFDEMKALADRITKESTNIATMKELSLIGKNKQIKLSKTKIILELKLPSLYDLLEFYRTTREETISDHTDDDLNTLLCIKGMLIPTGEKDVYAPTQDKVEILNILDGLNISDAGELRNTVGDMLRKYHTSYKIKSVKCSKCHKEVTEIPLDIRNILFTQIYENR